MVTAALAVPTLEVSAVVAGQAAVLPAAASVVLVAAEEALAAEALARAGNDANQTLHRQT
jgi:hypothetical protein